MTVFAEGVDYSFDHPDPVGLYRVGKRFAARYVGPGSPGKHLTPDEAQALSEAGVAITCIASGAATGMLGGFAVGRDWAWNALEHAVRCGMPKDRPIYMSCDFDVKAEQWPVVRECLRGAESVLGHDGVGIYGGYDAIAWTVRDRAARWLWQTYAWSESRWHPAAHLHQYRNGVSLVGGTVDLDRALTAYFGQWRVGDKPTQPPEGAPVTTFSEVWNTDAITNPYADKASNPTIQAETALVNVCRDTAAALEILRAMGDGDIDNIQDQLASVITGHAALLAAIVQLRETPLVDAVQVAAAIASHPHIAAELARGVAAALARIDLTVTLTGSASGGITPPPA